jgi:hypothetical protein
MNEEGTDLEQLAAALKSEEPDDAGETEESTEAEDGDRSGEPAAEPHETVVELEELLVSPGTYFNPQTEVVVVVDDSTSLDQEIFNMEAYEGAEWVRVSDEVAVDEEARDELMESFQTHYHPGAGGGSLSEAGLDQDDGEEDEGETGQDPGRED